MPWGLTPRTRAPRRAGVLARVQAVERGQPQAGARAGGQRGGLPTGYRARSRRRGQARHLRGDGPGPRRRRSCGAVPWCWRPPRRCQGRASHRSARPAAARSATWHGRPIHAGSATRRHRRLRRSLRASTGRHCTFIRCGQPSAHRARRVTASATTGPGAGCTVHFPPASHRRPPSSVTATSTFWRSAVIRPGVADSRAGATGRRLNRGERPAARSRASRSAPTQLTRPYTAIAGGCAEVHPFARLLLRTARL